MGTLGTVLAVIAGGAAVLAHIWVLVSAFQKSIVWGLLVLFIPFVALIFILVNFSEMKYPVLLYVVALLVGGAGAAMSERAARRHLLEEQLREATSTQ